MISALRAAIEKIPTREERLGGQTFKYVKLSEVLDLLDTFRSSNADETSDRPPMRTGLELIRDGQIPQGMSPALFADRVLRVAAQLTGDPYKAVCQGGSGGKCTDPDCEKCWPEEPEPRHTGIVHAGGPHTIHEGSRDDCAICSSLKANDGLCSECSTYPCQCVK